MRHALIVLASAVLSAGSAGATVIAQASIDHFELMLVDLDPNDGITPMLSSFDGNTEWHTRYGLGTIQMDGRTILTNTPNVGRMPNELAGLPGWGVSGRTSAAGTFTSAYEVASAAAPSGTAHSFFSMMETRLSSGFIMTPMTAVQFRATPHLLVSSSGGAVGDAASARAGMQLVFSNAATMGARTSQREVLLTVAATGSLSVAGEDLLTLDFVNRAPLASTVGFVMYLNTRVRTDAAPPAAAIPEPATSALLAAGLAAGVAAAAARKRPSRPGRGGNGAAGCCESASPPRPPGRPPR